MTDEQKKNIKQKVYYGENRGGDLALYEGNPYGREAPNSSAGGKYQFLLELWTPKIKEFADSNGFKFENKEDFLNNSTLQEEWMNHYIDNYVGSFINDFKGETDLSEEQLALLYHSKGRPAAQEIIENSRFDEKIGSTTPNEYFKRAGVDTVEVEQQQEPPKEIKTEPPYVAVQDNTRTETKVPLQMESQNNVQKNFRGGGVVKSGNVVATSYIPLKMDEDKEKMKRLTIDD